MNLITRTIENPFHTVVLNYDKEKNETAFEKELLKRYLSFLNKMHKMRERIKPLRNRYYKEQLFIEENAAAIAEHHQHYKNIEKTINRFMKEKAIDADEFHANSDKFYAGNKKYLTYHSEKVDPWRDEINENEKEFDILYKWFSKGGDIKAYKHFNLYGKELYKNYSKYSMDVCRYDINVDNMKGAWQKAKKEYRALFQLREDTVALSMPACDRLKEINTLAQGLQRDINELYNSWQTSNN